jgi:hypothetical protein
MFDLSPHVESATGPSASGAVSAVFGPSSESTLASLCLYMVYLQLVLSEGSVDEAYRLLVDLLETSNLRSAAKAGDLSPLEVLVLVWIMR